MANALLVGLGGFFGSVARYSIGGAVQRWAPMAKFPYGTLSVNILGCFTIGLIAALAENRSFLSADGKLFLLVGVLGGFTTFSSFAFESLTLSRGGATFQAIANVTVHFVGCLLAVWLGDHIGRLIAAG